METTKGLVDWRGRPINPKVHGGVRAAWFLYFLVVVNFLVQSPNLQNLVTYLRGVMHMGVSDSSTTVTNFIGAMCAFALLGAFISDSYITCSVTTLLSVPLVILGFGLLTLQAHLPSFRPPHCNPASDPSSCMAVNGWRASLLYIALYIVALGEGFMRACIPALGADQFDDDDPSESHQKSSFFNWFAFCLSMGVISGLILIVWLQNRIGWDFGFGLSALLTMLGLLVAATGLPFYRNRVPQGSALARICQVLVVAYKNRKLELPEKMEEAQENNDISPEDMPRYTSGSLKLLDKACINTGSDGAWSVCDAEKVEETKAVLRMLPLVLSATVAHLSSPLLVAFTVQQGGTTNTRLGRLHVYPAMLAIIPSAFQMPMLVAYDRLLVPFLRRRTGYTGGITHLQRVGIGFMANVIAPVIAAIVEKKRKDMVAAGAPLMSLFWLAPQFFMLGMTETTSFVGSLEFFNSEAPHGMKSIGVALFWCQTGMASLLGTMLMRLVNKVTRHSGSDGHGWLEGADLNSTRLDLFYWVVAAVAFLGWLNFIYWAKRYKYMHNPRINVKPVNEEDSMT